MWKYVQDTGDFFHNGTYVETGYSGRVPDGKNQPLMECVRNVGPVPRGHYAVEVARTGPTILTLPLTARNPSYCTPARSGFLIHGDNSSGTASTGCIILSRATRQLVADSDDRLLLVVRSSEVSRLLAQREVLIKAFVD